MWFMNKVVNPFVRLLLRSPLHRLLGSSLLLITYTGRKSGREYTLPVQYAREGDTLIIIPGMPEKKTWWRNLVGGRPVRVVLGGATLQAQAEVLQGAQNPLQAASWLAAYLRRFPAAAKLHSLQPAAGGGFHPVALEKAARSIPMVAVKLG